MHQLAFRDEHNTYTRISKRAARKRYEAGLGVYIIAHKMRPGAPWHFGAEILPELDCDDVVIPFDARVRNFNWYNANCHETGYYAAFYIVS